MPKFVSALQGKDSKTVVTVSEDFAKGAGLTIVDQPAVGPGGRPLPPRPVEKKTAKKATAKKTAAKSAASDSGKGADQ